VQRVVIVGSSGSGKSTLARQLERRLGLARLELDSLLHQPGWQALPQETFRERVEAFVGTHERWVVDGNYSTVRDLVWLHADTLLWLDLPRPVVMLSLLRRTLGRALTREVLWNGNRERWDQFLSLDPERSVIAWSYTRHYPLRAEYEAALRRPEYAHLLVVRLRSRRELAGWSTHLSSSVA